MLANTNLMDPWAQIICLLGTPSRQLAATQVAKQPRQKAHGIDECLTAAVTLIDRPTTSTATVAWRDATRGCFGDQLWRTARARIRGFCAMSGQSISPGDAIYKPNSRSAPINADAMILACVLREAATSEPNSSFCFAASDACCTRAARCAKRARRSRTMDQT